MDDPLTYRRAGGDGVGESEGHSVYGLKRYGLTQEHSMTMTMRKGSNCLIFVAVLGLGVGCVAFFD